jgi:D-arabinose 1-dehydrogenase-like Zn-dependent alcohol dehydrogenase
LEQISSEIFKKIAMPSFKVYKGSAEGIQEATTTRPELVDDEVLVRITASGLCGTDLHFKTTNIVLGHEGMGTVEEVGTKVKSLRVGDRVGWGFQTNCCGMCVKCLTGNEEYCPDREMFGQQNLDQGSFAEAAVWKESFLFKVPDIISDAAAAPLMCGGATVWSCLRRHGLSSTSTVGVVGVGGLGHLGIQFASKMGMKVVVLSSNADKKEEALRLGASQFVTLGQDKPDIGESKLDALLISSSVAMDWDNYLPLFNPQAVIFPLTLHYGDLRIPQLPFVLAGLRIQGVVMASRAETKQMLEFAATWNIRPITVQFPLNKEGIEESMRVLEDGKMRYRGVLVAQ